MPLDVADEAALSIFADDVLDEQTITLALEKLMAKLAPPVEDVSATRTRLTAVLKKAEKELANLTAAVAAGDAPAALMAGIREREQTVKTAQAELKALDRAPAVVAGQDAVREEALAMLKDWRALLMGNVAVSRQLLRKLLGGDKVTFYPTDDHYEIGVTPSMAGFFAALPTIKTAGITQSSNATAAALPVVR